MPPPGSKIDPEYENPVDNLLYDLSDRLSPLFRSLGATPNLITALSGVLALAAVWALQRGNVPAFGGLWMLGHLFDCMDGHYARLYGMTSAAGDWFDHAKDYVARGLVWLVLFTQYSVPWWVFALMVAVAWASFTHVGCQQLVYSPAGSGAETMDAFRKMCPTPDGQAARYTRYVAGGTVQLALIAVAWLAVRRGQRV